MPEKLRIVCIEPFSAPFGVEQEVEAVERAPHMDVSELHHLLFVEQQQVQN